MLGGEERELKEKKKLTIEVSRETSVAIVYVCER